MIIVPKITLVVIPAKAGIHNDLPLGFLLSQE